MKVFRLEDMIKGWFVGNFYPSLYKTNACEVAVKKYKAGMFEDKHYHKVATEITVVTRGTIKMFGQTFSEGQIIIVEPGEITDFIALTDSENVVVKIPGVNNDKYILKDKK